MTAQLAGGDLDGDLYFSINRMSKILLFIVSWDERLIPNSVQDPMKYDTEKEDKKAFREE